MKIVITEEQKKLIKESTNRSAKLLGKFYDIEADGAYYLGDGMIESHVILTPKDFDNPMTPEIGGSICYWKVDKPFSSDSGDLTFMSMNLPHSSHVPLMDHIGNTGGLEEYLKGLHREESEEFVRKINHRRNNPLKESVVLNEGKYDKIIERILNDSEVVTDIEYRGRTHDRYSDGDIDEIIFWFEFPGRKRAQYRDMKFLTKNNQVLDIDFDSRFPNLNNLIDGFDTIPSDVLMKYFIEKGKEFLNQYLPSRFSNHINENVDKNKKFLTKVMGQDFTGKIKEVKDLYDVPLEFDNTIRPDYIRRVLNYFGPMYLVDIDGKKYLYQYRIDEEDGDYEWFHDEHGFKYVDGEIPEQLGLDELGLEFSDVIDLYFNQEGEPLNESVDKNKKFLTNFMDYDFTGKIKEIKDPYDVPLEFGEVIGPYYIKQLLNHFGSMYLLDLKGIPLLYQDRGEYEYFMDNYGIEYVDGEIPERLGLEELGFRFSDVIDMFINEGEPLNEEYDKPEWLRENTKVKNLLKKLFENKEYEFSFKDKWEDLDGHIETYAFYYHIEILNAIGVGSDTIARVQVIIDDILLDGESVYDGWVEIGYSNNVWYINNLENHLDEEFFDVFPFSIYVNFYGHDEER